MPSQASNVYSDFSYTYTERSNFGTATVPVKRLYYVGANAVTKGGPVPRFRELIAAGKNATTSLVGTEYRVTNIPCSLSYGKVQKPDKGPNYWRYSMSGQLILPPFLSSLGTSVGATYLQSADNQAVTRFLQNLSEVETAFKGMVFSGELRETLRMIRSPARSLRSGISNYLSNLKRSYRGMKFHDRQRFVRDTWLEYSFGWKPLINDIDDAITAFYKSRWPRPIFQMVRGSKTVNGTTPYRIGDGLNMGQGYVLIIDTSQEDGSSVKYYGVYHSTGSGASNSHLYGFSPWEFVPTLWELIPYSFLVDYFTNIGDIVSSWSYRNIGCSWAARGQSVYMRRFTSRAVLKPPAEHPDFTLYSGGEPGSSTVVLKVVERSSSVTIPIPSLELEVPGMKSTKWLNLAALSQQLSSTRRQIRS